MSECADAVPRAVHRAARDTCLTRRDPPPPARAHGGIPPFAALLTFPSGADGERPDREGTRVFRGIGLRTVQLSSRY